MSLQVDVVEAENVLNIKLRFAEENPYLETLEISRLVVPYDASYAAEISPVVWKPGQVRLLAYASIHSFNA